MRVDGITLLQMIKDEKIKDNSKIIDNTGKEYIYYDSTGNLNEITQLIGDNGETERMYNFTPYQLINYTFEILEEKPKEIERFGHYNDICIIDKRFNSRALEAINRLNAKVDEQTKAINYLLKKEDDK